MISIVVPVYNGEAYIKNILNNFISQTYKNFELIFVDDGSEDKTIDKIVEAQNNSGLNIKLISQSNKGVSVARNTGIEHSSGKYICFCDVDDFVTASYLDDLLDVIKKENVDVVVSKLAIIKNNKLIGRTIKDSGKYKIEKNYDFFKKIYSGEIKVSICNILIDMNIIKNNKLKFSEGYSYGEDIEMLYKIISCSRSVAIIDKSLYFYRLNPGSAMDQFGTNRLDAYVLISRMSDFFRNTNKDCYLYYKKFGAARIMWSITWQAAVKLEINEFNKFIENNAVYEEFKRLLFFSNFKVAVSTWLFFISPNLFRILARKYGAKHIH